MQNVPTELVYNMVWYDFDSEFEDILFAVSFSLLLLVS